MKILIDTKEQLPYDFSSCITASEVLSTSGKSFIHENVKTGDYTIRGMEDIICIERKKSVAELAGNSTEARFKRELERMSKIKHSFLVLEFSYFDIDIYPEGSDIPKSKWKKLKIKGPFIMGFLASIQLEYGINVLMCGNRRYAEFNTYKLLERVWKKYRYE